jgi:hypothetical protein
MQAFTNMAKYAVLTPARQQLLGYANDAATAFSKTPEAVTLKGKELEQAKARFITNQLQNLPPLSPAAVSAQESAGANPFGKLAVWNVTHASTDPTVSGNWQKLTQQVATAVKAGDIAPLQAAKELSYMAKVALDATNQKYEYSGLAMPGQKNLVVKYGDSMYDLTNPTDVQILTARAYKSSTWDSSGGAFSDVGGFGPGATRPLSSNSAEGNAAVQWLNNQAGTTWTGKDKVQTSVQQRNSQVNKMSGSTK